MKLRLVNIYRYLILALVLTALVLPVVYQAEGASVTITSRFVASIPNGLSPADPAWTQATQMTVTLDSLIGPAGVPQLLPSSKWRFLKVKSINNGTDIFFRYEWTDATTNDSVADAPTFADAVAMEIPFITPSTVAMGNQREPVNIIFWRANTPVGSPAGTFGQIQNIVAGGTGTVQTSADSALRGITHSQTRVGTSWIVIMKRPMLGPAVDTQNPPQAPGNMVTLARAKSYRICFGQWDGAQEERNGVKMVAGSWQILSIQ